MSLIFTPKSTNYVTPRLQHAQLVRNPIFFKLESTFVVAGQVGLQMRTTGDGLRYLYGSVSSLGGAPIVAGTLVASWPQPALRIADFTKDEARFMAICDPGGFPLTAFPVILNSAGIFLGQDLAGPENLHFSGIVYLSEG